MRKPRGVNSIRITCGDEHRAGCVGRRGEPLVLEELWQSTSPVVIWGPARRTVQKYLRPPTDSEAAAGVGRIWEEVAPRGNRIMSTHTSESIRLVCPKCHYGPVDVTWLRLNALLDRLHAAGGTSLSVQALKRWLSDGVS